MLPWERWFDFFGGPVSFASLARFGEGNVLIGGTDFYDNHGKRLLQFKTHLQYSLTNTLGTGLGSLLIANAISQTCQMFGLLSASACNKYATKQLN